MDGDESQFGFRSAFLKSYHIQRKGETTMKILARLKAGAIGSAALAMLLSAIAMAAPPKVRNFVERLDGSQDVPARETQATGQAIFRVNETENETETEIESIEYRLIVANIENVTASHIHIAVAGVNGSVVAFLAGDFSPAGGRVSGVLAEGTITAANLVGPLAGMSLKVLVAAMRDGGAYVNVHTNDGVAPPNTGPGDFPGGEIRGQIRALGPRAD